MHLSAQVSKQKCALAFSPLPVFDNFHIRPDDEVEKHVSLTAGLENGSFDLQFRLTLHGVSHAAEHLIRDHATIWGRVAGPFVEGSRLDCISEPNHHFGRTVRLCVVPGWQGPLPGSR
jgi:hypothetical protein